MKWKNHLEIANAVADQLGLGPGLRGVLRQGSVQPDREGDRVVKLDWQALPYRKRVKHHRATRRFIKGLLWKARIAHLEGREEDAVWCLGRALHYVQDRSVAVGPFGWFHDEREAEIGHRHGFPDAILLGEKAAVPSPLFVDLCLRTLSPRRRTSSAMHQACMLSSALAFAVLSDPVPSRNLAMEIKLSERRHYRIFLPLAIGIAGIASAVGLWLGQPILIISSIPLVAMVITLDTKRRTLRKEAEWFIPMRAQSGSI